MLDILKRLSPRFEEAGEILWNEIDEQNEIIFFEKGVILVGYEINR